MSADIVRLSDYRMDDGAGCEIELATNIDLATAVDVAIRDLGEILACWGSETARQRALECQSTLRHAYCGFVDGRTASQ